MHAGSGSPPAALVSTDVPGPRTSRGPAVSGALALLLALALAPRPGSARPVPTFDARAQLDAAEVVARARIASLRDLGPATAPYGGGPVRRVLAALDVDFVVKGPVAPGPLSIELLMPGPVAPPNSLPIYTVGETYLVFLKRDQARWILVHDDVGAQRSLPGLAPGPAPADPAARLVALYAAALPRAPWNAAPTGASYVAALDALRGLGDLGGPTAAAATRAVALAPATAPLALLLRADALAATLKAGDRSILKEAVRFIETADPREPTMNQPQQNVCFAISQSATLADLAELHSLLAHRDDALRLEAVRAVRRLRDARSVFFLAQRLDDSVREVRYHAFLGLAEILGKYEEYAPAAGDAAREDRAVVLWKAWWKAEGAARFSPRPP